MDDPELEFISGRIFDLTLPKEKEYLWRYFTTEMQRHFVKYYLTYRSYTRFVDHTGYSCSNRWVRILKRRLEKLEIAHDAAKEMARHGDFESGIAALEAIETGRYKVR